MLTAIDELSGGSEERCKMGDGEEEAVEEEEEEDGGWRMWDVGWGCGKMNNIWFKSILI